MVEAQYLLDFLNKIDSRLSKIEDRLTHIENSTSNMDSHISFVNSVYCAVQVPFKSMLSWFSSDVEQISQISHIPVSKPLQLGCSPGK